VADAVDIPTISASRRVIDSKAMRHVRNQELQFVAENLSAIGPGLAVNITGNVRVLSGS